MQFLASNTNAISQACFNIHVHIFKINAPFKFACFNFDPTRADLAASTQAAIVDVLLKKSLKALDATGLKRLVVAGGVGANLALRQQLQTACQARGVRVHYPELALCTDNGAMIALAAALRLQTGKAHLRYDYAFDVKPRWPLSELSEN